MTAPFNKEWDAICKRFCIRFGYKLLFVNHSDFSMGYEDENGNLIHLYADEMKEILTKEEEL